MQQNPQQKAGAWQIRLNKLKTYFSKPQNVVLLLMGIVLTITTVAPIVAIVRDTFVIHPGTIDEHLTGMSSGYSAINYVDLFTSRLAKANLWTPLLNTWCCFQLCPALYQYYSAACLLSLSQGQT